MTTISYDGLTVSEPMSLYDFTATVSGDGSLRDTGGTMVASATRPCESCGQPDGTCTGDEHMAPSQKTQTKAEAKDDELDLGIDATTTATEGVGDEAVEVAAKRRGQGGQGGIDATATSLADAGAAETGQGATMLAQGRAQLSGADQETGGISLKTEAVEGSDTLVRVTEDVIEEVRTANAKRPTHRLVASAGTILTKAQVEALENGDG